VKSLFLEAEKILNLFVVWLKSHVVFFFPSPCELETLVTVRPVSIETAVGRQNLVGGIPIYPQKIMKVSWDHYYQTTNQEWVPVHRPPSFQAALLPSGDRMTQIPCGIRAFKSLQIDIRDWPSTQILFPRLIFFSSAVFKICSSI